MPDDRIVVGRPAVERPRFVRGRFDFIKKGYFDHSWLPAVMMFTYMFGLSQVHAPRPASAHVQVPPSSQRQWAPPNLAGYQDTLRKSSAEAFTRPEELVGPRKQYPPPD